MPDSQRSSLTSVTAWFLSLLLIVIPASTLSAQTGGSVDVWADALPSVRVNTLAATPNESHYIQATSNPDLWNLEKRIPGKVANSSGRFRLRRSIAIDTKTVDEVRGLLRKKGILSLDRQLVLGTYYDPRGGESYVSGIRMDVVTVDENGAEVADSVLIPMLDSQYFDKLESVTIALAEALDNRSVDAGVSIKSTPDFAQKSVCINYCEMEVQDATSLCNTTANACIASVTGFAIACVLACPTTGPLVIPCLLTCGAGDVFAVLLCKLTQQSCLSTARRNDRACRRACAEEQPF